MTTSPTPIKPPAELGRRPEIERELSETFHVDWVFHSRMPLADFDMEKSLHNQARFEAVDKDVVEQYAEAVKRGDAFPAVIAYRPGPRSRLVMIDGNHRLGAHFKADQPVDVYEVDRKTDKRTIALMTFAFNTKHGKPTSEAERVSQAIYLVDNGSSIAHAAAAVSLPQNILKRALARSTADARADEVGIKRTEWDSLAPTVRSRLSNISTDEGFEAATKLAFAAKLDSNEVFDLVALLNTTKSGNRQKALVEQQRELHKDRIQKAAGGVLSSADRKALTPKQRMNMSLGQVLSLPDDVDAIVKMYAQAERKDAAKRVKEAADRLAAVAAALAK